jgi:hypothetical protein
MKKFLLAASALLLTLQSAAAFAGQHDNKTVSGVLQDDRDCVFFTLTGVVDTSNNPVWFALARSHPAIHELFAMLLTARVMQLPVRVTTTGAGIAGCGGYEGVSQIWIKN